MAFSHWQMCIWTHDGQTHLTVRGPETKATTAWCPPDAEFLGIVFEIGTVMPDLPASQLVDGDFNLPEAGSRTFWLDHEAWQYPTFENADTFVDRLVRRNLLIREGVVEAALQGPLTDLSLRTIQRRFVQTTGLTHNAICQIERARRAVAMLEQGTSILDTVDQAGYYDQAHLTKALKRLTGQTPGQLSSPQEPVSLSFHWQY